MLPWPARPRAFLSPRIRKWPQTAKENFLKKSYLAGFVCSDPSNRLLSREKCLLINSLFAPEIIPSSKMATREKKQKLYFDPEVVADVLFWSIENT